MEKNSQLSGKYYNLFLYFILFFLPVVFIQKCEDAYYLPKLILLAGAVQLIIPVLSAINKIKFDIVDYTVFVFLILYAAGFVNASTKFHAFMRWVEMCGALSVFLYIRHFLTTAGIKKVVILMITSAGLVSIYAFIQVLNLDFSGWITNFSGRAFSSLGNPDFLGGFLVLVIPLAVYIGYEFKRPKISAVLFLFFAMVLILSQTRSSLAAFIAGLILLVVLLPGYFKKNIKFLIIGLIAVVLVVITTGRAGNLFGRLAAAVVTANPDLHGRYDMWAAGLRMIKNFPLFGIGLGDIKNEFCMYYSKGSYFETDHLHNDFIEVFAESGILSFAAFIIMLSVFAIMLVKRGSVLSKLVLASFTAMMVQAFFNFPFFIADSKLYFFALVGLALNTENRDHKLNTKILLPGFIIAAILMSLLIMVLSASMYLNTGINSKLSGDDEKAAKYLTKAVSYYYDRRPAFYLSELGLKYKNYTSAESYAASYYQKNHCSKDAAIQYSIALAESGKLIESLKILDGFLALYNGDIDAAINRGRILYMMGKTAGAIEAYERILLVNPDNEAAHTNLYSILINSKMNTEAKTELKRWNEINKK